MEGQTSMSTATARIGLDDWVNGKEAPKLSGWGKESRKTEYGQRANKIECCKD